MALKTYLDITVEDAQGYQSSVTFRIKPAAYGATAIPLQASIQAVADALFGDDKLSNSTLVDWQIRIVEEGVAGGGGSGDSPTSEAVRFRSKEQTADEFLVRVPGLAKSNVLFDPQNPNAISTATAVWTDLRDALIDADIAVSSPTGAYDALTSDEIAQHASAFDGRRTPLRPR